MCQTKYMATDTVYISRQFGRETLRGAQKIVRDETLDLPLWVSRDLPNLVLCRAFKKPMFF
ncbi:MAG: hypothetical protein EBS21_07275 [Sphingomonadaceae bacterium]|nr:hypothetical protein [Sphingomonadaceae bacterium]